MYNSLTKATHEQKLQSSLLPEENKSKILFRDTLSYYINLTKKKRIKIFNIAKKKKKYGTIDTVLHFHVFLNVTQIYALLELLRKLH